MQEKLICHGKGGTWWKTPEHCPVESTRKAILWSCSCTWSSSRRNYMPDMHMFNGDDPTFVINPLIITPSRNLSKLNTISGFERSQNDVRNIKLCFKLHYIHIMCNWERSKRKQWREIWSETIQQVITCGDSFILVQYVWDNQMFDVFLISTCMRSTRRLQGLRFKNAKRA